MPKGEVSVQKEISLPRLLCLIFIPTLILTAAYIFIGLSRNAIPSLLLYTIPAISLFFLLAAVILFPIEIGVVLYASKREYGSFSLKSAFSRHDKMSWWKILLWGFLLFGFAGIVSVTIAPLENSLLAPISGRLTQSIPAYFDWNNIGYLKQYPKSILTLTYALLFIFNVIVGPIAEELFFRGYLTSKISRFGNFAPLIITVLFSLYHLWSPFNNLFRIFAFFPAAYIAWKKKNIYISIVFHCMSNLFSTIGIITAIAAI